MAAQLVALVRAAVLPAQPFEPRAQFRIRAKELARHDSEAFGVPKQAADFTMNVEDGPFEVHRHLVHASHALRADARYA